MSFGIEVIVIDFFRKVNVHDWTAYFNFFFVILERKRKKEQWKVINLS